MTESEIKAWFKKMNLTISDYHIYSLTCINVWTTLDLGFKSFKEMPIKLHKVNGDLILGPNKRFTSIKNLPDEVGMLDFSGTGIKSLIGISDEIKRFNGSGNGTLYLNQCDITEGGLGLVLIPGLLDIEYTSNHTPFRIINKYLGTDNIIECQSELIEAGFEEYAVL